MSAFYNDAVKITGENRIKTNEKLSRYTTFKIGGEADYIAEPENAEQIRALIDLCEKYDVPYFILGNGSNVLASDKGYRGMIIHIYGEMNSITVDGCRITAEAGTSLIKVARTARDNGLTGMEFASGIPGTVGGAVYMNAGAYGGEIKNIVAFVKVLDKNGEIYNISGKDMNFSYRHSLAEEKDLIITETVFELEKGNISDIDEKMQQLAEKRREKQPLEYPSAGSTFKRPEGYFAGKLIMDSGLRGYRVGDAEVSEKHCGFVINKGNATAGDVMQLISDVRSRVYEGFGVNLETEIKMLGEF